MSKDEKTSKVITTARITAWQNQAIALRSYGDCIPRRAAEMIASRENLVSFFRDVVRSRNTSGAIFYARTMNRTVSVRRRLNQILKDRGEPISLQILGDKINNRTYYIVFARIDPQPQLEGLGDDQ